MKARKMIAVSKQTHARLVQLTHVLDGCTIGQIVELLAINAKEKELADGYLDRKRKAMKAVAIK
jgi:hypothetical protein